MAWSPESLPRTAFLVVMARLRTMMVGYSWFVSRPVLVVMARLRYVRLDTHGS